MESGAYHIIPFVLCAIGAFIICYNIIPVIINVSHLKQLFDVPDYRKLHVTAIPNIGGIAIFASTLIIFSISGYAHEIWAPYLTAGLTILFFSGLKDDILVISPYKKLLLQCIAISLLIFGADLSITNFGGVYGLEEVPGWIGFSVTFFTMVVVINSFNLIDGIDGLAGGVGTIISLFFGIWFYEAGLEVYAAMAFILTGSLLAFLFFNFYPAKIFMGDTGSQVVGYLLAFFAVIFVQTGITSTGIVPFKNAVPVLVLAVLIVPLYDTLRVFIIRVFRGDSPFKADRQHIHHQLIDCGFSHRSSCFIIYGFNLIIISIAIVFADANINMLFAFVLLSAIILFPTARYKRRILIKLGFTLPSAEHINILEKKIMFSSKSVGFRNGKEHKSVKKGAKKVEEPLFE